jgi:hypothetical protein
MVLAPVAFVGQHLPRIPQKIPNGHRPSLHSRFPILCRRAAKAIAQPATASKQLPCRRPVLPPDAGRPQGRRAVWSRSGFHRPTGRVGAMFGISRDERVAFLTAARNGAALRWVAVP